MMKPLIDGSAQAKARLRKLSSRADGPAEVEGSVREIIAAVRRGGDRAVARYTKKFDGVALKPGAFAVSTAAINRAAESIDRSVDRALRQAHRRIVTFHKRQLESGYEIREEGLRTGIRVQPLRRVGVYVPGGQAAYPSSVLMNVVPAKVAGVNEVVVLTPPSREGIRPEVLAAAKIAGADTVLSIGGAQAVAAAAYGTKSIERVDKIVGPGNIYVATAKRLVFGAVDIDTVAGPSEVLILADGSADPEFVAADLLAQAEHDQLAAAICITTSKSLAVAIAAAVEEQLKGLSRAAIARESIRRYGSIFVVPSLRRGAELSDEIAPEHLEIFTKAPRSLLPHIHNAGAVFLGQYSTEPLGDYAAGPNHVLPTGGAARFSSPLGVYDFRKRISIIEANRRGLERLAPIVTKLAAAEGLEAHGAAVTRRINKTSARKR